MIDIAEEGEDAFAAMRRARDKKSIKSKVIEIAKEDLQYGLEKVTNLIIKC